METLQAIRTKRAVRKYSEQAVPEEIIRKILDAGRRAQSSKNTQPWQFVIVRERATLKQLAECGRFAAHLAHAAFVIAILTAREWAFDTGQVAAYLQLAAWDLGVSSCIASIYETARAKKILGAPDELFFEIALACGYAAEAPHAPKIGGRKKLAEIAHWEKW
ncbi:MAG: nitroreductase family protein [Chloroflexi bacterium]|nr:nitroreductase family protein [Chloroflexota bacterium]